MKTFNNRKQAMEYSIQYPKEITECKTLKLNESIEEHYFYLNGLKHGEYKWFYQNGSIAQHCFYKKGNLHGECKWFYKDETIREHSFFLNGNQHGECKWFYENGTIREHGFFLNDIKQPQLDYLTIDRDEITLTLLFGENYENI